MSEGTLFLHAVRFLTIVPVPSVARLEPDWLIRSAKYFPLVGGLIGGLSAAVLLAATHLWSGLVPALFAVAASVLLTGALHEDGLADSADALGGRGREARLKIMQDSRIGTYGTLMLGLCVALRVAALAVLPASAAAAALIAAHAGGRFAALNVMTTLPYVGDIAASKVGHATDRLRASEYACALVFTLIAFAALATAAPWWTGLAAALVGATLTLGVARLAARLIGGITGDVLGAIEQLSHLGILLAVAAAWTRS
jgi:adenosylcobinamide-GDP ribazoletransferase